MSTEKDETYTVVVKGKALASIKADLIHAFLSVRNSKLCQLIPLTAPVSPSGQRPPAQRHHADVLQAGVQARLHCSCHVPETGEGREGMAELVSNLFSGDRCECKLTYLKSASQKLQLNAFMR